MAGKIPVQVRPSRYYDTLRRDVRAGLTASPKTLPPKYFYDERGSELFDEITRLPEYYLTRAETAILQRRATEIADLARCDSLVELGSGTSAKTRLLIESLRAGGTLQQFVPFDVDPTVLTEAAEALTADFPGLHVTPVVGDFEGDLTTISTASSARGRRMIVFLGSTIGNLEPAARASFLKKICAIMRPGDTFLLGTDLVKDEGRLLRAYDDAAGTTAEFNRNVLVVLNRQLGANFDVDQFQHVAIWNAASEWIEMRLRSTCDQQVLIRDLDLTVWFSTGEEMRTEISAKFRPATLASELGAAGLETVRFWTDPAGDFGLTLAQPQAANIALNRPA